MILNLYYSTYTTWEIIIGNILIVWNNNSWWHYYMEDIIMSNITFC